jgi:hypothetical protein
MAISGAWLAANEYSQDAAKWGHGVNPIHAIPTGGPPLRSGPVNTGTGPGEPGNTLNQSMVDIGTITDWEYVDEEFANSELWGYGEETGTADRPSYGTETEEFRGRSSPNFPSAMVNRGLPGGTNYRAEIHGAENMNATKTGEKEETVGEGWENKETGVVENAKVSSESQYERQTSMQQRDQVREGSQRGGGSASEFEAPIGSHRPTWGQRIKPWSGYRRHYDMYPFQAEQIDRPFLGRQPGTGYVEWMRANEAFNYMVPPMQRQPVPDPYGGFPVPDPGNVYEEESYPVQDWVNVWY